MLMIIFFLKKLGYFFYFVCEMCGVVIVVDIGIKVRVFDWIDLKIWSNSLDFWFDYWLWFDLVVYKYDKGYVVVFGGLMILLGVVWLLVVVVLCVGVGFVILVLLLGVILVNVCYLIVVMLCKVVWSELEGDVVGVGDVLNGDGVGIIVDFFFDKCLNVLLIGFGYGLGVFI